jgi:nucleoside 2-deoxyribosyltransferase
MALNIYFAAPLFDDMELRRNEEECTKWEEAGFNVFLPQRDAGEAAVGADRAGLFISDTQAIEACDMLVAYIDGRVPDEGTVFEIGMAYALHKPIALVRTDRRSFMQGHLNVMLECCGVVFKNTEDAIDYFKEVERSWLELKNK